MVLQKKCPYCNNTTYMNENMPNAFCISCGRRINTEGAVDLGTSQLDEGHVEETFTVTFHYERRFASEYDTSCQITIDNHLAGVSSIDEPLLLKLTKGNHNVVIKVLAHIGISSTNVMNSINMYVDKNKDYYISAHGGSLHRKITVSDVKE